MKKLSLFGLLFMAITCMSSCDKAKIDVNFNMEVSNIYFNIEPTTSQGELTFATTSFTSDLQKKLDDNNASIDDVESIEVTGAKFNLLAGSTDFNIVDNANAYLSTNATAERRVAYKDPVPTGVSSIDLDVDGGNLKDYMKQSVIYFRATGHTNAPNTSRDSLQCVLTFKIKASVKP